MTAPDSTTDSTADTSGEKLSASELSLLKRAALLMALICIISTLLFNTLAAASANPLLIGLGAWFAWCGIVGAIHYLCFRLAARDEADAEYNRALKSRAKSHNRVGSSDPLVEGGPYLPEFMRRWQWVVLFGGLLFASLVVSAVLRAPAREPIREGLQLAAVSALGVGCVLYFLQHFGNAVQARLQTGVLNGLLHLTRIAVWVSLAAGALLLVQIVTARDFNAWLGWPLFAFTCLLVGETVIRYAGRFYQPTELRDTTSPAGVSLLLDAVLGRGNGWSAAVAGFEKLVGAKLSELWILQFIRQTIPAAVLGTALLAWLSTCFTTIPTGSRGVRVLLGSYQNEALLPGLHFTWPTPFERVEILATELVRTISLGFDKDLEGALLWTEKHVEGEKNLLIGNGETLLTINIPILYRIANPVAFLETTSDPDQALASLAERKLTLLAGRRDSFAMMTDKRSFNAGQDFISNGTVVPSAATTDIEFRPVGSTLLITPNINDDRTVMLRLLQEESRVVQNGADVLVPDGRGGFVNRDIDIVASQTASGTFAAKHGQTVAIGGLIREEILERRSQIPLLGDIPILGLAFRSQNAGRQRQEIILLMTPYIISTPVEAESVSRHLVESNSMHPLAPLGEGSLDLYREKDVLQPATDELDYDANWKPKIEEWKEEHLPVRKAVPVATPRGPFKR